MDGAAAIGEHAGMREYGVDDSVSVTQEQWICLVGDGARFAVVRAYRNADGGTPDTAAPATIAAARSAGLDTIDVYLFPVADGSKTAAQQADECMSYLSAHGASYGTLWIDVEPAAATGWSHDTATNIQFIQELIDAVQAAGGSPGIYTGTSDWQQLTGDTDQFSSVPLWWSSHDRDYTPFGGWNAPAMVQYAYDTSKCGVSYDSDYTE